MAEPESQFRTHKHAHTKSARTFLRLGPAAAVSEDPPHELQVARRAPLPHQVNHLLVLAHFSLYVERKGVAFNVKARFSIAHRAPSSIRTGASARSGLSPRQRSRAVVLSRPCKCLRDTHQGRLKNVATGVRGGCRILARGGSDMNN